MPRPGRAPTTISSGCRRRTPGRGRGPRPRSSAGRPGGPAARSGVHGMSLVRRPCPRPPASRHRPDQDILIRARAAAGCESRRLVGARALDDAVAVRRHRRQGRVHLHDHPRSGGRSFGGTTRRSSPTTTSPGSVSTGSIWSGCRSGTGCCTPILRTSAAADILDAAMDSAERYGLKVLLDLHARLGLAERPRPQRQGRPPAVVPRARTPRPHLHALEELARRYRDHPALWGIELVNEPTDWRVWQLWHFHRTAYRRMAEMVRPGHPPGVLRRLPAVAVPGHDPRPRRTARSSWTPTSTSASSRGTSGSPTRSSWSGPGGAAG